MSHPVTLQGASRSYEFDVTRTNALCQLEEAAGLPYLTMLRRMTWKKPPARLVELFVQAALIDPMPVADIRFVLQDIGGLEVIQAAVRAVLPPARRERMGGASR
jgi:hypothetical protein